MAVTGTVVGGDGLLCCDFVCAAFRAKFFFDAICRLVFPIVCLDNNVVCGVREDGECRGVVVLCGLCVLEESSFGVRVGRVFFWQVAWQN